MAKQDPKKSNKPSEVFTHLGLALSIPSLLVAGPLVGYGLGMLIQHLTGWGMWVSWLTLTLGIVAGIRETIKVIRKLS